MRNCPSSSSTTTTTTTTTIPDPELQSLVQKNASQVHHIISEFKKSDQASSNVIIPNSDGEENKQEYTLVPNEEVEELLNWIEKSGNWSNFILLTESSQLPQQISPQPAEQNSTTPDTASLQPLDGQLHQVLQDQDRRWALQRLQDREVSNPQSATSTNFPINSVQPSQETSSEGHNEEEEDWVLLSLPPEEPRQAPVHPPEEVPDFGVSAKLSAVLSLTGQTFMYGYTAGCLYVLRMIFRNLFSDPLKATSVGTLSALGAYWAPQVVLRALGYVVLSGVVSGTVVATPVLIVGTSGVFVSASVYHAYHKLKRLMSQPKSAAQE